MIDCSVQRMAMRFMQYFSTNGRLLWHSLITTVEALRYN